MPTIYSSKAKPLTVGSPAYRKRLKELKKSKANVDDYVNDIFEKRQRFKSLTPIPKSLIAERLEGLGIEEDFISGYADEPTEKPTEQHQASKTSHQKKSDDDGKGGEAKKDDDGDDDGDSDSERAKKAKKAIGNILETTRLAGSGGAGATAGGEQKQDGSEARARHDKKASGGSAGAGGEAGAGGPQPDQPADEPAMGGAGGPTFSGKKGKRVAMEVSQPADRPQEPFSDDPQLRPRVVGQPMPDAPAEPVVPVQPQQPPMPFLPQDAGGSEDGVAGSLLDEDKAVEMLQKGSDNISARALDLRLIGKDSDEELKRHKVLYRNLITKLFVSHSYIRLEEICLAKEELKRELKGDKVHLMQRSEMLVNTYQDQFGIKQLLYGLNANIEILRRQLIELYVCAKHVRMTIGKKGGQNDILSQFNKVGVIVSASSLGLSLQSLLDWANKHGTDSSNDIPSGTHGLGGDIPDLSELAVSQSERRVLRVPDGNIKLEIEKVYDDKKNMVKMQEDKDVKKINYRDGRFQTVDIRAKKTHHRATL